MKRLNASKKFLCMIAVGVLFMLFLCNMLTPYIVDDFAYLYSYKTGERITSIADIPSSILAHSYTMNGRWVAHSLVQLFGMFPKTIFNVINSVVFVGMLWMMYKFSKTKDSCILFVFLFGLVWIFTPAFGQVFLWLTGSCNYMWSVFTTLVFLVPYTDMFLRETKSKSLIWKIFFIVFSLIFGAFSENVSATGIFMASCFVFLDLVLNKTTIKKHLYSCLCIGVAFVGYLTMMFAPVNQASDSLDGLGELLSNFVSTTKMYANLGVLLIGYVILLVLAYALRCGRKRMIASIIFLIGSLCSNFIIAFASDYPERRMIGSTIFLVIAIGILIDELFSSKEKVISACICASVLVCMMYYIPIGVADIFFNNRDITYNEKVIEESREKGELDVVLNIIYPQTKYSAVHGLRYLSAETPDTWPNESMAKYYEVNSILGKW